MAGHQKEDQGDDPTDSVTDDGGQAGTAAALQKVQSLLDEARAALTDAADAVDEDASKFQVKLV